MNIKKEQSNNQKTINKELMKFKANYLVFTKTFQKLVSNWLQNYISFMSISKKEQISTQIHD